MFIGHINREELEEIKGERRKRIFISVTDVIFLSAENASTQSPRMTKFFWELLKHKTDLLTGGKKSYWKSPSKTVASPSPSTPFNKRVSPDHDLSPSTSKRVKLSNTSSWQEKGKARARDDSEEDILTDIEDSDSQRVAKESSPAVERSTRRRATQKR
jgi:hypothetical protein